MTCKVCGSTLIYYENNFICPNCNGFHILEKKLGATYTQRFRELTRDRFIDYLVDFDKYQLIFESAAQR